VGIINNSGGYLYSITLSSTGVGGSGADIFGFDGDGPCYYAQYSSPGTGSTADCFNYPAGLPTTAKTGIDPFDYQGPNNSFSNYSPPTTGTVNFITPIPNGGSTWFALEGPPSSLSGVTVSNTLTVTELGTGIGTVTDGQPPLQQISCAEKNGIQQPGSCTGTYASGTLVTLTATANSSEGTSITPSPENPANGSTFLGWISGPCAGTTTSSCSFTITSSQTVIADFAPNPSPVPTTIAAGTNVIAQAEYACPSLTSPCTDPNAYGFSMQFPVVSTSFQYPLYIVATEVYADGICPGGQVQYYGLGYPTGHTTDFDCRFVYTFNYGTTDLAGDTVVPLCDAYANGNCVHFLVYAGTPGTEPPLTSYTGPLFETFSFTNNTFSPGSYWAGSTTRAIADPDADEVPAPLGPLPYGTSCSTPMQIGTPPTQYSPEIYCQFDLDVTAFIDTGGKTNQANDFVVAFQPTVAPLNPNPSTPIPALVAPTIAGTCINGCTDPPGTITVTEGTGVTFEVTVPAPTYPTPYPAPNLTASTSGTTLVLPNGLTYNGSTGVVSGTPADGTAGSYPITFTAANGVPPNATLSYTLTVNPAGTLSIAASSGTMTYGGTPPTITPIVTGLVNTDTVASLGITCSPNVTSLTPVGTYKNTSSCTASSIPSSTYSSVTYPSGTVTVAPATGLTIAASSGTMTYGGTVPTITAASVTGLAGSDTIASLGITCSTTATNTSPVIASPYYSSSCSTADANYSPITYVPGTVTVNKASTTTTLTSSPNLSTSDQQVTFTATVKGQFAGTPTGTVTFKYGSTTLCNAVTLAGGVAHCAYSALPVGSDTVTATYSGDGNFTSGSGTVTQTVTVTFAGLIQLVKQFDTNPLVRAVMVADLELAEAAESKHDAKVADGLLDLFIDAVTEQSGKSLTAAQAAMLIQDAKALMM